MATYFGSSVVLSKKSTSVYAFYPLTDWIPSTKIKKVRAALEMRAEAGSVKMKPAFQVADDVRSAGSVTAITTTTEILANGIEFGSNWDDVSDDVNAYQFVRFGVQVANETGTTLNGCWASLRVDVL